MTIGDVVSRIRNIIKATDIDDFITDRFIWSLVTKHASSVITKNAQVLSLSDSQELYMEIPHVKLENAIKIEDCGIFKDLSDLCGELIVKKSTEKLPKVRTVNGRLMMNVYSLDKSVKFQQTTFSKFSNVVKTRYYKLYHDVYYILSSDYYLYILNEDIDAVSVEASFIDAFDSYNLLQKSCDDDQLITAQSLPSCIPQSQMSEIESMVLQDLFNRLKVQDVNDLGHDNKSIHSS